MTRRASSVPDKSGTSVPPLGDGGEAVDVARLRRGLMLSQAGFARRFGLSLPTLRNWERGVRQPDAAARAYLTVIARDPERVAAVFGGTKGEALQQLSWRELRAALDAADRAEELASAAQQDEGGDP